MASLRCFVIGNGPSLTPETLSLLKGEYTFATGRINLMYPLTEWRPNCYVMAERAEQVDEFMMRHDLRAIIGRDTFGFIQEGLAPLVNGSIGVHHDTFTTCRHALDDEPPDSWHLPELCSYGSSVHVALQIATNYRFNPIYLIGCDLGDGHFDDNYGSAITQPELWQEAHEIAHRSNPNGIFNATIGGELEVYERVDLCQLL